MAVINSDWDCNQNLRVDTIHKIYRPTSIRLVIIIILQVIYIYLEKDRALWVYVCSIFIAEKEIRLCKSIAKFSQNLPFSACKILRFGRKI